MTDFLLDPGTNGYASLVTLMSSEAGFGSLANGGGVVSSVNGSSGVFTQSSFGSMIWGDAEFVAGGSFTPAAGGYLACWWLNSLDASNFETVVATPSATVFALSRPPDFIIPLSAAAYASGNRAAFPSFRPPRGSAKLYVQNLSGATLPASGNIIKVGPWAVVRA